MLLLLSWHNYEGGIDPSYTCDEEIDPRFVPSNSLTRCEAVVAPITVCNQNLKEAFSVKNYRKYRRRNG